MFDEAELRARAAQWKETVGKATREGPELLGAKLHGGQVQEPAGGRVREDGEAAPVSGRQSGGRGGPALRRGGELQEALGRAAGRGGPYLAGQEGSCGGLEGRLHRGDRRVFKEEAGDLLVELGYERDYGW